METTTERMIIKRVKSFKYLGITLDETLNWSVHVNILCESLLKYFSIFNPIKYKVHRRLHVKFTMHSSILVFNMESKFIAVVRKRTQIVSRLYKISF